MTKSLNLSLLLILFIVFEGGAENMKTNNHIQHRKLIHDKEKYKIEEGKVYHIDIVYGVREVEGADAKTFKSMGEEDVGKDQYNVFERNFMQKGVDVDTFEQVFAWKKGKGEKIAVYWKDKYKVYTSMVDEIKGADPETFKIFKSTEPGMNGFYSTDKNNVYWMGKKLKGANPSTFSHVSRSYYKDKNSVYHFDKKRKDIDAKTFQEIIFKGITTDYYKDKNKVFIGEQLFNEIVGADPNTFEVLRSFDAQERKGGIVFSKDKKHVYHIYDLIIGADPDTFEVINNSMYSNDKNHIYFLGKKAVEINVSTFRVLFDSTGEPTRYGKDNENIYYNGKKIKNNLWKSKVDLKTFTTQFTSMNIVRDKNYTYERGVAYSLNAIKWLEWKGGVKRNDLEQGAWSWFYKRNESGYLSRPMYFFEDYFVDGKLRERNGYHKGGQIRYKKNYKDGKLSDDVVISYYKNGEIQHKKSYKNGKLNGDSIYYRENGQIISKSNYKDGNFITRVVF
ncbi:MAG: DKNYY domain-containing protein [Pontiella sp.]